MQERFSYVHALQCLLVGAGVSMTACGRIGYEDKLSGVSGGENAGGVAGDAAFDAGGRGTDASTHPSSNGGSGGGSAGGAAVTGGSSGASGDSGSGSGGIAGTGGSGPSDAGSAGSGGSACPACPTPVGFALSDTVVTARVGGNGGTTRPDVCPSHEVVIGYDLMTDTSSGILDPAAIGTVITICGKPAVSGAPPHRVAISESAHLPVAGGEGTTPATTRCPADQVVVGFDGRVNNIVVELAVWCAPLEVTASAGAYTVGVGTPTRLAPVGSLTGTLAGTISCPPGTVARGNPVREGAAVDSFSLACAKPSLTYAAGVACSKPADCESATCSGGTCRASTCVSDSACTCESLDGHDYAFCKTALANTDAVAACAAKGMRLVRVDGAVEDGWLRGTSALPAMNWFRLGADSLAMAGDFRWSDGTLFSQGGPAGTTVAGMYVNWYPFGEAYTALGCVNMVPPYGWETRDCAYAMPYVCERY